MTCRWGGKSTPRFRSFNRFVLPLPIEVVDVISHALFNVYVSADGRHSSPDAVLSRVGVNPILFSMCSRIFRACWVVIG
jgi:hypothetical protein